MKNIRKPNLEKNTIFLTFFNLFFSNLNRTRTKIGAIPNLSRNFSESDSEPEPLSIRRLQFFPLSSAIFVRKMDLNHKFDEVFAKLVDNIREIVFDLEVVARLRVRRHFLS